jgi:hypothetical protein
MNQIQIGVFLATFFGTAEGAGFTTTGGFQEVSL